MHFGYLQDDWKVAPNLTVNMGLRYEFGTPQWEGGNHLTNFDPATTTLLQATDGSIYDRTLVNPDRNNFAPRVGVAYSITPRTVIRSAYGMSYIHFNRLGGENLLSFNGPHVVPIAITQQPSQGACAPNQAPTACFRPTQQGYPEGLNVPANFNPLNGRVNHIPSDLSTGYVQSWHLTVQRELLSNLLVDVAYIGNKSDHLMILGDLNQARPNNPGENTLLQLRRPIQTYQFIQSAFDGGRADYRALQVKVERRWSDGLYLLNSFTWSRGRDNASGHLETANGDNSRVNYLDLEGEFGLSGYNQPLNNTTSVVWELPFGEGRRWGNDLHPVVEAIAGGWRVTAINTMTSGLPVNLNYAPSQQFSGERRADLSPECLRRDLRGRGIADDRQLVQQRQHHRPHRSVAAVRQRAAQRRAWAGGLHARPRAAQEFRPRHRPVALRGPHRGFQRPQQDQPRRPERYPFVDRFRHDPLPGHDAAADSARRQGQLLVKGKRRTENGERQQ